MAQAEELDCSKKSNYERVNNVFIIRTKDENCVRANDIMLEIYVCGEILKIISAMNNCNVFSLTRQHYSTEKVFVHKNLKVRTVSNMKTKLQGCNPR